MTKKYAIRFVSLEGGVSLFVNGFLIFGPEDSGRSVTQASLFIRPGKNIIELVPNVPKSTASVSFADVSEDDPQNAPILLSLSTDGELPVPVIRELEIDSVVASFKWQDLDEIEKIELANDEIYRKVQALGKALQNGPDNELIKILDIKHNEIASAVGLSKQDMDTGLLNGLSLRRETPEFAVDVVDRTDFLALKSSSGRIVNARRKSGGHALTIMDGDDNPGFKVALAKINGNWTIIR